MDAPGVCVGGGLQITAPEAHAEGLVCPSHMAGDDTKPQRGTGQGFRGCQHRAPGPRPP